MDLRGVTSPSSIRNKAATDIQIHLTFEQPRSNCGGQIMHGFFIVQ